MLLSEINQSQLDSLNRELAFAEMALMHSMNSNKGYIKEINKLRGKVELLSVDAIAVLSKKYDKKINKLETKVGELEQEISDHYDFQESTS